MKVRHVARAMTGECSDPGGGWAPRRTNPALLLLAQGVGRFALHDGEAGVVVGELCQVGQRDLPGDDRIVRADVGLQVPGPMLELHAEPHAKLLEVAPGRLEVDLELRRDGACLIPSEIPASGQVSGSLCHLLRVTFDREGRVRPGADVRSTTRHDGSGPQGMERDASVLVQTCRVMTVGHVARCPSRGTSPPARSRCGGSAGAQFVRERSPALDAPPQPVLETVGMKR